MERYAVGVRGVQGVGRAAGGTSSEHLLGCYGDRQDLHYL